MPLCKEEGILEVASGWQDLGSELSGAVCS